MANKHYKLVNELREKQAVTSAGVTAPTAQPAAPIQPKPGMPGSGPLDVGNSGGSIKPVLGGGTGLSAGTDQPAGFLAGMNQKSEEAQLEQEEALGDAQGEAQKMQQDQLSMQAKAQQDQLNMQAKAQQDQLNMQVQNQQQTFKKDEELHRTKMELETLKAQTNATQAASAATPGVSPLIPTTAKRLTSKAKSLLKMSYSCLPGLLAKQAYTYKPPAPGTVYNETTRKTNAPTSRITTPAEPTSLDKFRSSRPRPTKGPLQPRTLPVAPPAATPTVARTVPAPITNTWFDGGRIQGATAPAPRADGRFPVVGRDSLTGKSSLPSPALAQLKQHIADNDASKLPVKPNLGWLDALRGSTALTDTPEERAKLNQGAGKRLSDTTGAYAKNPAQVGNDPRYYDAGSIRSKLLQVLGAPELTPLEREKMHAASNFDPKEPLVTWRGGLNRVPGTIIPKKIAPLLAKHSDNMLAVPDFLKNTWNRGIDYMGQGNRDAINGFETLGKNIPFHSGSWEGFKGGLKQLGSSVGNNGKGIAEMGTLGIGGGLLGGVAKGLGYAGRGLGFAGGIGASVGAGSIFNALTPSGNPQDLDWADKARALELGITPEDPNFHSRLASRYNKYYNGKVPSDVTYQNNSINPGYKPSSTDASTLQGTGYLHGDKIFNPMGRMNPYQQGFMNLVTPMPSMYPQSGDPYSMQNSFNNSAAGFGRPAYMDQYRGSDATFAGNSF